MAKLKILFLSHTHRFESYLRVGSHHLAESYARAGHEVAHMSAPIPALLAVVPRGILNRVFGPTIASRCSIAIIGSVKQHGVLEGVPISVLPNRLRLALGPNHPLVRCEARFVADQITRRTGVEQWDLVLVDKATLGPVARLLRAECYIYRPTDDYVGFEGHEVRAFEAGLIELSRAVVATSHATLRAIEVDLGKLPVGKVVENGRLARSELSKGCPFPGPQAGMVYVGSIDSRLDLPLLEEIARRRPSLPILVAGQCSDMVRRKFPNINFLGPIDPTNVANLLRNCKLGLLPLTDCRANRSRSPIKVFQYAAEGLPTLVPVWFELPTDFATRYLYRYSSLEDALRIVDICAAEGPKLEPYLAGRTWDEIANLLLSEADLTADDGCEVHHSLTVLSEPVTPTRCTAR